MELKLNVRVVDRNRHAIADFEITRPNAGCQTINFGK